MRQASLVTPTCPPGPRPRVWLRIVLIWLLLWALGGGVTFVAASQPSPGQPVTLQLKWRHQFQFAGYYAAQLQGYYRQEGLNVTIREGDALHPPIREVLAGHADFGVTDADVLRAYLEGNPLVVLAAIFQHSPYILLTRADSGLRTPTDLRGKTIMLQDEQGIAQLQAIFSREGMSLQDVHIVPHQWNNELLIHRQVDAISAYSTVEPFQLKARGVEPGMIRAMDYGVDFYGDTLFTTRRELQRRPDVVAAFRRASLRGWEYALAHPDQLVEHILQMPGVRERGITREMLRYEAQAMRDLILPGLVEIGRMNPGRWEAIARTYAQIGLVRQAPSEGQLANFIYDPAAAPHEHWLRPLLLSLGLLALLAAAILIWNFQLRRSVARRTAALRQAQQQLDYHVQNSPLAIIEWDAHFRVTRWTGQAEQVFGWRAAEVLHKHPDEWPFVPAEDRSRVQEVLATLSSGRQPRHVVHNRNYRKDGALVDCEWYNSVSLDPDGKVHSILSLVLDVTDRTQAEALSRAALRNVELERSRLAALFDALPAGVAMADEQGRVTRFNGALTRIWGGSPSFPQGIADYQQWHARFVQTGQPLGPEDWAMARALRTGQAVPGELIEIDKFDGSGTATILNAAAPIRDPEGRLIGAVVAEVDLTEQRRAQEALRQSELRERQRADELAAALTARDEALAQLNGLLANAPVGFAFFDREYRYARVNEFLAHDINGLPVEAHLGRSIREVLPVNAQVIEPLLDQIFASGQTLANIEVTGETPTVPGKKRHWLTGWFPVRTPDGRIPWVGVTVQEITQQKRIEAALQRRNRHLQLLHQAAASLLLGRQPVDLLALLQEQIATNFGTDVLMLYEAAPESGRLQLTASVGLSPQEQHHLQKLRFGRAICARPAEALQPIVATHIQSREAPNRRFLRKLGFHSYLYFPLLIHDRLEGTLAFASRHREDFDDTDLEFFHTIARTLAEALERHRLERELQRHAADLERLIDERTAKLRETIGELEGFSYSLVHDLRAPLRAMQSYATIVQEDAGARLLPAESNLLNQIRVATSRMDQLITDSLNYSRILSDNLPLGPVNLGELLRGMVETYPNLHPPQAEITVEFGDLVVYSNQAALTQVFSNLLGNAVKFVAPGVRPRIRVWAKLVDSGKLIVDSPAPSGSQPSTLNPQLVRVSVEDNGIGIPKDRQEKIFGMFQRLHRVDEYPGTGIGLALVQKSLERTGGRVGVESSPGQGSCFWVELPLAQTSHPTT